MRVIFIHGKEFNAHPFSLSDVIAEALMQKMRQEEIVSDENQAKNTNSGNAESTT